MRWLLKIWFAGFYLLLYPFGHIVAQTNGYNIEIFTIENGLSQSFTNIIFQNSKGFLWIGTKDGINKYNGYTFEKYRNEPTDSCSLVNNYITAIAEDLNGNLWIGTKGGLSRYDRHHDRFTNFLYSPSDNNALSSPEIYDLLIDKKNNVWIKTRSFVERFDSATNGFKHFKHYNSVFSIVPAEKSFPLMEDLEGKIYIGSKDGLQAFDPSDNSVKRFYNDPNMPFCISNNFIKCLTLDKDGVIWIGTDCGMNAFDPKSGRFKDYYFNKKKDGLINQINDILIDSDDNMWVATNDGLVFFDRYSGKYRILGMVEGISTFVDVSVVFSIIEDKSKILWLTTPKGLIKIDKKPQKLQLVKNGSVLNKGIEKNNVTSLLLDNKNIMWVGTSGEGIKFISNIQTKELQFSSANFGNLSSLNNRTVYSMIQDSKGLIWIGTDDGLFTYDNRTKILREFCRQSNVIPCNLFENRSVYAIMEDNDGDIWLGSSRGIHVYDRKYEIVRSTFRIQNAEIIEIENVNALFQDDKGFIWVGCDEGLIKYNKQKNIYFHYGKESALKSFRILGGSVYSIYEDKEGLFWLGTSYGLQVFHPDSGVVSRYTIDQSLPNNLVYSIVPDLRNDLWLSTNRGICHFSPKTGVVRNFDIRDGLQGYEYNIGAGLADYNGRIYFGGVKGINYFNPDSIKLNLYVPPIEITSLEIYSGKNRVISHIEDRDEITIPYGKSTFDIYFAALDYTYPERNQYAYKMCRGSSEEDWIYRGNHDYASFSNISPGEYFLHVIGSNSDNIWNYDGKKIKIIIKPPVWQTRLAYIIYAFLAIVLINLFLRIRTKSLRKANRTLRDKELAAMQIAKQKEELTIQNKNIRDSINYARRIQQAILPSEKVFQNYLPESFIYYQPKDIVSGDFYWIQEIQDKIFLAAVDCTGHGVPGAFMSIIGFELFRRLRAFRNFDDPAKILLKLNDDFGEIFKDIENISLKDGMDVALCIIDKYDKHIKFAGAFSPFYIVRDDKVIEIKGDRYSVGVDELNLEKPEFTTHHIEMQPDDIYYIFSDGYADQFGGPEGKKYKFRRFRHLLLSIYNQPFEVQKYLLEESMIEWRGEHEQVDDIMVIGFKVKI
ncbi:MAG: SpoIIE family protein phosphatase [Bacteroidales bacterium]|nr:SpoIIE family protein phosphatase [Bacteroidales bacterium]